MLKFNAYPLQGIESAIVTATMKFLDQSPYASAYQFPYPGFVNEWLFQVERDGQICFSGRGSIGYAASRYLPFLKVLSFNRGPMAFSHEDYLAGIDFVMRWARNRFIARLEIQPDLEVAGNQEFVCALKEMGWNPGLPQKRFTLRMDVTKKESELLAALPSSCRYKINRAYREGIRTELGNSVDHLHAFVVLYRQMTERKNLSATDSVLFERIWGLRGADKTRIGLVMATCKDQLLGANLLFRTGRRVEYLFGAVLSDAPILHGHVTAGYPLQWAGMLWAKSNDCEIYDFGGYNPYTRGGPALMKGAFFKVPEPVELCPRFSFDLMPLIMRTTDRTRCFFVKRFAR